MQRSFLILLSTLLMLFAGFVWGERSYLYGDSDWNCQNITQTHDQYIEGIGGKQSECILSIGLEKSTRQDQCVEGSSKLCFSSKFYGRVVSGINNPSALFPLEGRLICPDTNSCNFEGETGCINYGMNQVFEGRFYGGYPKYGIHTIPYRQIENEFEYVEANCPFKPYLGRGPGGTSHSEFTWHSDKNELKHLSKFYNYSMPFKYVLKNSGRLGPWTETVDWFSSNAKLIALLDARKKGDYVEANLFTDYFLGSNNTHLTNNTKYKIQVDLRKVIEESVEDNSRLEAIANEGKQLLYLAQGANKPIPPLVQKKRIDKIQTEQYFDNAESQLLYSDISVSEAYVQRKIPRLSLLADFKELTLQKYETTVEEEMFVDVIKSWDQAKRTPYSSIYIRPKAGLIADHHVLDGFQLLGKPKKWSDETRYFAEDDLNKWLQGEGGTLVLSDSLYTLKKEGITTQFSSQEELLNEVRQQQSSFQEEDVRDNLETVTTNGKQNLTPSLEDSVLIIEDIERNSGTAFYIRKDLIITNQHVVEGSDKMTLTTNSGKRFMAEVIAQDERTDLALLQTTDLGEPLELEPQCKVNQGDSVITMGHPVGLEYSMTRGIISSSRTIKNPFKHNAGYVTYLQIDAALSPGNSGGPLINDAGFVVGVNTWGVTETGGINFSVHCSEVKKFLMDSNINDIKEPNESVKVSDNSAKEDSNWSIIGMESLSLYPRNALSRGIEGCVMLETTVTREGSTKDTRVLWKVPEDFSTFATYYLLDARGLKFKPTGSNYSEERVKVLVNLVIEDPSKPEGYVAPGCEWEGKHYITVVGCRLCGNAEEGTSRSYFGPPK